MKYHDYIPKGIQVTKRIRVFIKKHQRGDNSKSIKVRDVIFVRDTLLWPVLRYCEVSTKYSERYLSYRADTKMLTDGQTTDGRQAHRYIPQTIWSGIKSNALYKHETDLYAFKLTPTNI